jgi:sporulation protein YlmC with PRC-barrel domain
MVHDATLHDYTFADARNDVRGSEVYGRNDEKIGTIDDVILDHATGVVRYAVIDAGGWFTNHRYLITAGMIEPYSQGDIRHFFVDMSREQVRRLPRFEEDALKSEESWKRHEEQHKKAYSEVGGVMHRTDAPGRIITPPLEETGASGTGASEASRAASVSEDETAADMFPRRITPITAPPHGPTGGMMHPDEQTPTSAAVEPISSRSRWQLFQDDITRDLTAIRNKCGACGAEHQQQRKAG